jgi:hypothetical protein
MVKLDMNCTAVEGGSSFCIPSTTSDGARPSLRIDTTLAPAALDATAACTENSKRYQSWQLENWFRKYEMDPASLAPGSVTAPKSDTGPSFTLKNTANNDMFSCTSSGQKNSTFDGSCKSNSTTTTAKFQFDPKLDFLTITQEWNCGNS